MRLLFKTFALLTASIWMLWLLRGCVGSLYLEGGLWLAIPALLLAPLTVVLAPWYALIAYGHWLPLLVAYSGSIVTGLLYWAGSKPYRPLPFPLFSRRAIAR